MEFLTGEPMNLETLSRQSVLRAMRCLEDRGIIVGEYDRNQTADRILERAQCTQGIGYTLVRAIFLSSKGGDVDIKFPSYGTLARLIPDYRERIKALNIMRLKIMLDAVNEALRQMGISYSQMDILCKKYSSRLAFSEVMSYSNRILLGMREKRGKTVGSETQK